tara:strand:+ start:49 stop:1161 length:1113 start_codon:yes stop_codon:yes gene_type:complete
MAYTLFPTTSNEITKKVGTLNPKRAKDIIQLFTYLKSKFKSVKTPINIDTGKLNKVNVSRELQGMIDIKTIMKGASLSEITLKFGSGSSGNRGVKNRGNLFENAFATGVRNFWANNQKTNDVSINKAVIDLAELFNFLPGKSNSIKHLIVKEEGAQNTKRPLKFQPGPYITSPTGSLDIGPAVTDLTLHEASTIQKAKKSNVISYLSLKLGGTTTFFNVGIKKILTKSDIQSGSISNKDGQALLEMFGIDDVSFCKIFNGQSSKGISDDTFSNINKNYLESFLQSGIGYGFTVVHKINASKTKVFEIDKAYMMSAAKPKSCKVYYGGKTGKGKRVDIEVKTGKYMFKINIRDTQGTDGYPTRIMGDFTYL